jgi:hypothetical protein
MSELSFVPDIGHGRSAGGWRSRRFDGQAQRYTKPTRKAAAALQPVMVGDSDKPDSKPVDGIDALLQTLALRNRSEPAAAGGL